MANDVMKMNGVTLEAELELLRNRLNNETEYASTMRQAYEAECRRSARDDAKILGIKQQLEIAEARVMGMKAEIAEKYRLLDETQGREAEESRKTDMQEEFERASEHLALSEAALSKLKVEYAAMPEKIRTAEWRFHDALRIFNAAKEAKASVVPE